MSKSKKLYWHPAFIEAMQQELFEYLDVLEFRQEHHLTTEPLQIDLIIIKKKRDIVLNKNIAKIFRGVNVIEYKSPSDNFEIKDFHKVYAYANLYAVLTPETALEDITISLVVSKFPRELVQYLKRIRGYKVEEKCRGVHVIIGDHIPIQIIHSKKLSADENLWLSSLKRGLIPQTLHSILKAGKEPGRSDYIAAYMDIIARANSKKFSEVIDMATRYPTSEEVAEMISDSKVGSILMEKGIEKGRTEGIERGSRQAMLATARNALAEGLSVSLVQKITGLDTETIEKLAK